MALTLAVNSGSFFLGGSMDAVAGSYLDTFVLNTDYLLTTPRMSLMAGRKLAAAAGAVVLSGTAITMRRNVPLAASSGSVALSGDSVTLSKGVRLAATSGARTLLGANISVRSDRKIASASGAITLSGADINLVAGLSVAIIPGFFNFNFNDSEAILRVINTRYARADDAPRERSPLSGGARAAHS